MEMVGEVQHPIARKDYDCDASIWIYSGDITGEYYTFSELRQIVKAKRDGWKIKKGQKYIKQTLKDGGELFTFRAREDMHKICVDNDIYRD